MLEAGLRNSARRVIDNDAKEEAGQVGLGRFSGGKVQLEALSELVFGPQSSASCC